MHCPLEVTVMCFRVMPHRAALLHDTTQCPKEALLPFELRAVAAAALDEMGSPCLQGGHSGCQRAVAEVCGGRAGVPLRHVSGAGDCHPGRRADLHGPLLGQYSHAAQIRCAPICFCPMNGMTWHASQCWINGFLFICYPAAGW